MTGRQRFLDSAEARYQARKRQVWSQLKAGDRIVVQLDGERQDVTVLGRLEPDLLVSDATGRELMVNRYQFCAVSPRKAVAS